jgi:hypothetical protein
VVWVRIGSLPRKPPRAITGLPVWMMYPDALLALDVAKRYQVVPWCASRYRSSV